MNNFFDLLNCRNKLCKGDYAFPINEETVFKAKQFLEQFKLYIEGLKFEPLTTNSEGELVLKCQRKIGFLGLIICLTQGRHLGGGAGWALAHPVILVSAIGLGLINTMAFSLLIFNCACTAAIH
ncbi:unnamed protein product [Macrosiphum euphorbiae]|uniref:Uncharacterized protein n=1 Tax=Macrosiphum euphorbiae TaxID=13131 RepID=A0AAV0W6U3_9HEMI|nr:unnamed protein product [Macrosiphum euphorbiae]